VRFAAGYSWIKKRVRIRKKYTNPGRGFPDIIKDLKGKQQDLIIGVAMSVSVAVFPGFKKHGEISRQVLLLLWFELWGLYPLLSDNEKDKIKPTIIKIGGLYP